MSSYVYVILEALRTVSDASPDVFTVAREHTVKCQELTNV